MHLVRFRPALNFLIADRRGCQGLANDIVKAGRLGRRPLSHGEQTITIKAPDETYYTLIGKIITNWAMLEARLASAIWRIAEIPDAYGASITSQIYTLDGKVKALQAILRERGYDSVAEKLGTIIRDDVKGLADIRNRIVHDPVRFKEDGCLYRLEIAADRRLSFGYKKVDLEKLRRVVDHIDAADDKIFAALKPALDEIPRLPPSPDKSGK